jgi:hypothetical protein
VACLWSGISAFRLSGVQEVEEAVTLESRVSNSRSRNPEEGKEKFLKRLRDHSRWVPIGFHGFGTQEVELHGQHNSRNCEERNTERWVPSINQRICAAEVKGGVKLR